MPRSRQAMPCSPVAQRRPRESSISQRKVSTEVGADKEAAGAVPKKAPDHGVGQTGAAVVGRQLAAPEHAMDAEAGDPDRAFAILENVARPLDRQPLGRADDAPAAVIVRGDA